jgi:uridine kinase
MTNMVDINEVVARIVQQRSVIPEGRSLLVGVSGIDGSGKGYIAKQIEARLGQHLIAAANINADDWLNLPEKRFNMIKPAEHFYGNAIRFDELFAKLLLPLKEQRSANLVADCTEETARNYSKQTYSFKNVGVVLVEGIFLFKRELRSLFDLTIWVQCSFPTAMARALTRAQEGLPPAETIRAYETIYFPAQKIHFARDNPRETVDLFLDNDSEVRPGLALQKGSLSRLSETRDPATRNRVHR